MFYLFYFLVGAGGALAKDIIQNNALALPRFREGKFYLGFIGGILIGGMVGILVDRSYLTGFLSGYFGKSIIEKLVSGIVKK